MSFEEMMRRQPIATLSDLRAQLGKDCHQSFHVQVPAIGPVRVIVAPGDLLRVRQSLRSLATISVLVIEANPWNVAAHYARLGWTNVRLAVGYRVHRIWEWLCRGCC